ncbi:hypothetical protein IEQ34_006247 [Dendrobium chrysotoxum]|uniref:Uncharacterized protein n=1 Tax=Dendrobium chrysotoxum TaxID=161865 RepID=A0AAV7HEE2_DENCH|nr:hypothetical protein IEQ34_006247 [Dendrobium chrysotoxum]
MEEKVELNPKKTKLYIEERKQRIFTSFSMKKDYICLERINRILVNILHGLELHIYVFNSMEQKEIIIVQSLLKITIEKNGIILGILCNVIADHIPNLLKLMIKRLITSHVLSINYVHDSCIINIYDPGDYISPHIDSNDFERPFSIVECNIIFGHKLKSVGSGEFIRLSSIPLPVVSCKRFHNFTSFLIIHLSLISNVLNFFLKFCRIYVIFRKMDKAKRPHNFKLDLDLQNIKSFDLSDATKSYHTYKRMPL